MLCIQILVGAALFIISTEKAYAFVGRAPFAPNHNTSNIAADIEWAKLAGHPYSAAEIEAMEEDGFSWTYFRLTWFLLSLVLSVLHRCLLFDIARHDPGAIGTRRRQSVGVQLKPGDPNQSPVAAVAEIWTADVRNDQEYFAAEHCCQTDACLFSGSSPYSRRICFRSLTRLQARCCLTRSALQCISWSSACSFRTASRRCRSQELVARSGWRE